MTALEPHDRLDDPFTIALCVCAVLASFALVDLEGTLFWGGSLVPYVCAFSILGPAPAVLVGLVGELSVWVIDRYRAGVIPLNLLAVLAPNLLGAEAIQAFAPSPDGVGFYLAVLVIAIAAVALNLTIITVLSGLYHRQPIALRLRNHTRLAPAIAINILVALGAIAIYFKAGFGAALFVLAGVLVFTYLARQVAKEREHLGQISHLAGERGALVARILEAEDRERRAFAELLHDDILQAILAARQDIDEAIEGDQTGLTRARSAVHEAIANSRRTLSRSHLSVLDRVGLAAAIATTAEGLARRSGFRVEVDVNPNAEGPHDRLIYSASRELLTNVYKHAAAQRVSVRLTNTDGWIELSVADDGCGLDEAQRRAAAQNGHVGLASLEDRVTAVGGRFEVLQRLPAGGTTVRVMVPREGRPNAPVASAPTLEA